MAFPMKRQQNVELVKATEESWTDVITRLDRNSASKVSHQRMYPSKGLNSFVIHEATHVEQSGTARPPQPVQMTRVHTSPTKPTTTIASTRHDPIHSEVQSGHESPSRGDKVENWFREAFDNMRRQEDMRAEARRFVDADAETKRALRVLERVGGGSGAGGRGHSWRKQWGEFELQWIGGWTDEGVHAEVDRDVLHDWSWRERLA